MGYGHGRGRRLLEDFDLPFIHGGEGVIIPAGKAEQQALNNPVQDVGMQLLGDLLRRFRGVEQIAWG